MFLFYFLGKTILDFQTTAVRNLEIKEKKTLVLVGRRPNQRIKRFIPTFSAILWAKSAVECVLEPK